MLKVLVDSRVKIDRLEVVLFSKKKKAPGYTAVK